MLILFIDDDYEDFELFCEASQSISPDIRCVFKHNGAEGLRYLQHATELPDCIFLDINMPVMDGVDCLNQIRMDQKLNDVPVIIFSTDVYAGNVEYYKKLGANEFINKPATFPALVQILRNVIDRLPRPPKAETIL